ncbi:uncharacterized protein EI97DRAFT_78863 [Westerdykella ornata]|uniref:MICOS complex subunit MIC12 n=1 Tax=Westerdykella ornata TaxID=318751 RepID=A0A6A6JJW3_WESOR|nr:uncharacterized protein EI97DRAFT_78863 [Westerdykella ornata]KAF2275159.1 hypothetical protein EI97DRAFT_78863 [Westerdykella ornata]
MGFTTGFLGGFTLTSAVLYLTVALHQKNRATQASLLRQQRLVLSTLVEPQPPALEPTPRETPVGLTETLKDMWNRKLEGAVRTMYETDWRRVREDAEDKVSGILEKIRETK